MLLAARPSFIKTSQFGRKFTTAAPANVDAPIKFKLENAFKTHRCGSPSTVAETTGKELLGFYKIMYKIRRMEVALDGLYKSKFIRGFCHLYNGQEAIIVGVESVLTKKDHVITAYRDHAFPLFRGGSVKQVMAELTGRATGTSKGNGGSMHLYNREAGFHGGHGIVGAQGPLGTGLAFAAQYQNTGGVCATFYGDGAANQGQLFEAFNMAALWKLPVIYICENNQYAMGTSTKRAAAEGSFYTRGAYIPGLWVDGMDVLAVREATKYAAEHCRTGQGPIMLEMNTYRYVGHSMSDPGTTYRTRDEVNKVRDEKDPIKLIQKRILDLKIATPEQIKEIENEVRVEVEEGIEFAKTSPEPPAENVNKFIYVEDYTPTGVELPASWEYKI
eukprot:TRINITY_DN43_c0_g1_i1.p1 TRINITY_DN43_c0_g1~~TRINITY_DN43_c0_g1_i1.p1  ORF type:complete len:415 (-),score=136.14 TRINITY_DN43_c0_g1_i1:32-1195(-)